MLIGWVIYYIITNVYINKSHGEKIKFNNNLFTKIEYNNVLPYKGSIQYYRWKIHSQ